MERMDIYEELPRDMREYLSHNGWHFSKDLCSWAVGRMTDRSGEQHKEITRAEVMEYLRSAGVELENDILYDAAYVFNMAASDFLGSSLADMASVARYTKDYLDDIDGTETRAMDEFTGRCIGAGVPVPWHLA